jgi:tetratricopeptide (TPR) repeat protein
MSETTSYPYETRLNIHCQQGEVIDELALTDAGYLAEILAAIDEADRALKELDSAIAKEPAVRAVALNNIALVYLMDKRFTEAEDCLQRALALVDGASLLCEPQVAANYAFLHAKLAAREPRQLHNCGAGTFLPVPWQNWITDD